ncbi:MAG: hypothetical protein KKD01_07810 [Proteobacteria bacterium]|nr:hypothetical protein [Pseudomonadota bacterium]MBU1233121.1 hypothetical protein [Pseudomonadota bacterium]MBU1419854.1 hypothetical protein [Pseudomonadota bacterium]MBU1454623.1 hypothetical protein [Pseudomonadota bacterium]
MLSRGVTAPESICKDSGITAGTDRHQIAPVQIGAIATRRRFDEIITRAAKIQRIVTAGRDFITIGHSKGEILYIQGNPISHDKHKNNTPSNARVARLGSR